MSKRIITTALSTLLVLSAHSVDRQYMDQDLKAASINKGVNEDWMGTGNKNGQLDLGDGTYIIGKSGAYGVMVIRNNPMPRVRGTAVDFGCFEFNSIPGLLLFVR